MENKKLNISVSNRLVLTQMLKTTFAQGNFVEILNLDHILKKINFSETEISDLNLKAEDNGSIVWDNTKAIDIEIDLTKEQEGMLHKVITHYDTNNLIEHYMLPVLLKIKELE